MTNEPPDRSADRSHAVAAGWEALAGADWLRARDLLLEAPSDDPRAAEGLAWAHWWCNELDEALSARHEAYRRYRHRDDRIGAARAAIWLGCDYHELRGEHAVANGWHRTARRLLDGEPVHPEHGWLAFQEGAYALELGDDTATARQHAAEVSRLASTLDHPDLRFLGLALEGLALVTEGAVADGMSCLDEVAVAAITGELQDRTASAWSLCYLLYACERVRDVERAVQWCARLQEVSARYVFEFGIGMCRAHYGSVLVAQGDWVAAEAELQAASNAFARTRPRAAAQSTARIAELRRRQGRLDDAAAMFESALPHPIAVTGLAHLAFDGGDAARALDLLAGLLATTPTAAIMQRADALCLATRVAAAMGDVDQAAAWADELSASADVVRTRPMLAAAAWARSAVASARGALTHARQELDVALDQYTNGGLPYEASVVRSERDGRAEDPVGRAAPSSGAPLAILSVREREVLALLAEGCTDRELAVRLHISRHTAHRHVSNIFTKLGVSSRAAAVAIGVQRGPAPVES